jgi:uncharacterized glyoxalase superfamily protein PhnB
MAEPQSERDTALLLDMLIAARDARAFAAGLHVTPPLGMQRRGACYGKLTDRFGVQWRFNCAG